MIFLYYFASIITIFFSFFHTARINLIGYFRQWDKAGIARWPIHLIEKQNKYKDFLKSNYFFRPSKWFLIFNLSQVAIGNIVLSSLYWTHCINGIGVFVITIIDVLEMTAISILVVGFYDREEKRYEANNKTN